MNTWIKGLLTAFLLIIAGCNSGHGPDSIFNHKALPHGTVSMCIQCHNSANSPSLDPLVTNGSGTFGKHIKHVQERGIDCERCHYNYLTAPTHMNGVFDTGNPAANLVNMNIVGPAGLWTNDTGTGTGSCVGVACHGNATLDWYGTNTWTLPACTTCHTSSFSAALDPTVTNGTPPAGRHVKHVTSRNIDCERCHYNYPSSLTHANGVLDTGNPNVSLVRFNIVGSGASWTNDTGAGTGDCASVSCHASNTLGWYGTGTWTLPSDCKTCHSSNYMSVLDPLATNGTDTAGKHIDHVTYFYIACSKCHNNYPSKTSHANGSMDTPNPAVLLVYFDATNPTGTWLNDTGPETGTCSSLFCHGTENPAWYGIAGVSFPTCDKCHNGPIGSRRQIVGPGGDFGQNPNIKSHHVSGGTDPESWRCLVCHDISQHMSGTVRVKNADTGAAIAYDPASPSSLEPFCLSCHDSNGANGNMGPFADGSTLGSVPYRAGVDIKDNWNKSYGHRWKGVTCLGTGAPPNMGCHANAHGTAYIGLLAKNLQIPQPDRYRDTDFAICFDCHQYYPAVTKEIIFGVLFNGNYDTNYGPIQDPLLRSSMTNSAPPYNLTEGIKTRFRDQNYDGSTGKSYDDYIMWGQYLNLHWFHIASQVWSYRGTTPYTGFSCTACHSVHGSNTKWGMLYDNLQYDLYSVTTPSGTDSYGMMSGNLTTLDQYPTYCMMNCHGDLESWGLITHSWYDPPNE